jgi:hypothetical protein
VGVSGAWPWEKQINIEATSATMLKWRRIRLPTLLRAAAKNTF